MSDIATRPEIFRDPVGAEKFGIVQRPLSGFERLYNEILTEVAIPPPKPGVRAWFEKLRPRGVWDFAMASLAMSLQLRDQTIDDARVVFGGIAGKPLRETAVENFLKGKTLSAGLIDQALPVALANAAPLKYNATKIDMAKGLLASGLAKLSAAA